MSAVEPSGSAGLPPKNAAPHPFFLWQSFARFISSQNPFYLLSVAFVLHSTKLWYEPGSGVFDPWPLMGVIGGYILLLALTGFVLVRLWKVWDDARSILLMLLLLFVELSLTFDTVLVSDRATGRLLLVIGLAISIAVSEGILLGLRMRLPALFRVPYYLLLCLLFLYPLVITAAPEGGARWWIFGFSSIAGLLLLTLLPAIRRGPESVRDNGTPWRWPLYPWSLFVFLIVCIGLRAYALALSFDPVLSQNYAAAMLMESAFGAYFLVPLVLVIGVLLLEAGLASNGRKLIGVALAMPVVCLVLSIPDPSPSVPYGEFLAEFLARFGSPVRAAVFIAGAFYAFAWFRGVRVAADALAATLLLAAFVGRETVGLSTLTGPNPWSLWLMVLWLGVQGIRRRDSLRSLVAALCAIAALRSYLPEDSHTLYRDLVPLHIAGLAVLTIGAVCRDSLARYLRKAGIPLLAVATLTAAVEPLDLPRSFPEWAVAAYLASVVGVTIGYAYLVGSRFYFFAGLANGMVAMARLLVDLAELLARVLAWKGAGFFVAGICWFALAVLISAAKAGAVRRFLLLIPRRRE